MEKNHDFNNLKQQSQHFESIICNFYLHQRANIVGGNEHTTRKRFTEKTKIEMREHYALTKSYTESAKAFHVHESTLRNIVKTPGRAVKLIDKGNCSGAGRPITYPLEVENDLIRWILELRDLHVPVSVLALQEKAKGVVLTHNPDFNASRGWVVKFFQRHCTAGHQ